MTKSEEKVLCCKEYPCLTTTYIYQQWREIHLDYCVITTALESKHKTATAYRSYAYSYLEVRSLNNWGKEFESKFHHVSFGISVAAIQIWIENMKD